MRFKAALINISISKDGYITMSNVKRVALSEEHIGESFHFMSTCES